MTRRWGKAGQRLTDQEVQDRARLKLQERNKATAVTEADNAVAYRLWRAGEMRPDKITMALDAKGLYGPDVDTACGASEPDVDLWEAGKLYPTWEKVLLLSKLTGNTPRFFMLADEPIPVAHTTLRFHGYTDEPLLVRAFDPAAVAARMTSTPPTQGDNR